MGAVIITNEKRCASNQELLNRMQKVLLHRGETKLTTQKFSSSAGEFLANGNLGMAYAASIDTHIYVQLDGAIYNREELCTANPKITIDENLSDEAVILQLYKEYGFEKTLQLLDGTFAISLFDVDEQVIYVARDRMGEKPIYYYNNDDICLFASEYKAFYCHPKFKPTLNEEAVSEYFLFRYPAGENTFLRDVYLVKPGAFIEVRKGKFLEHIYWTLPKYEPNNLSFEENKSYLKELISKSISRRLSNATSVGAQLSGGVDSSYVAYELQKQMKNKLKSFSITMDDEISEEKYIDEVVRKLQLSSRKLKLDSSLFLNNWAKGTWYYESPMQHEGNVPLLKLNSEAKKEVSLLFCGDGADEIMGGYPRLPWMQRYLKERTLWHRAQILNILKGHNHYWSLDEYYISLAQFLQDDQFRKLRPLTYKRDIKIAYKNRKKIMQSCNASKSIHRYLHYEIITYLLDTLLRGDKLSAASSMEMRAPLLMNDIVEFIQTVPEYFLVDTHKQYMYNTKILLKSLCSDVYGPSFTYREKIGLGIPMHKMLNSPEMKNYIESTLLPRIKERGVVDYDYLISIWRNLDEISRSDDGRLQVLWLSLSFEIWAQMYIDNNPVDISEL